MHNTITINLKDEKGKNVKTTFKFNLNSDAIICEGMGITLDEFDDVARNERQGRFLLWVFYSGIHNYLESIGDAEALNELTYHKVVDWISDSDNKETDKVLELFVKVRTLKNDSNNGQTRKAEASKKK
jgi:hypothetical protein